MLHTTKSGTKDPIRMLLPRKTVLRKLATTRAVPNRIVPTTPTTKLATRTSFVLPVVSVRPSRPFGH